MRPSLALQTHREAIREIALRHRVRNVRVFGSVLHGEDTEDSDLDLLVDPTSETTLMDIGAIRYKLKVHRTIAWVKVNLSSLTLLGGERWKAKSCTGTCWE